MSKQKAIMNYSGITKWHEAGYTGKGIKIMSIEPVSSAKKFPNVIAVNGYNEGKLQDRNHGDNVMKQMMDIAPDATFITCSEKGNTDNWKPLWLDYILNNNVHLFTCSYLSTVYKTSSKVEQYMQECIDNGTTFFIAAGNASVSGGGRDIAEEAKSDKYLTIGACEYYDKSAGQAHYSCEGEELDYMTIVGYNGETGTSFATNRFAAMCSLVQQFFLEKAGRTLYRHELISFIDDNLVDLKTEGFDIYTGNGLFRLPDPETIKISNYVTDIDVGDLNENIYYGGIPQAEDIKIKQMLLTPSEYTRPQTPIKPTAIAWHYVANPNSTAVANRNYFESLKDSHETKASSHYIIGLEGEIIQCIPDTEKSFCTNQANDYAISIECCHPDNTGRFTEATYNSMIWLGKYLMQKYGIKNNIRHYDVTGKICPKWFVDNPREWENFKNELGGNSMEEVSDWAKTAWEWCKGKGYLDGTNPKGTVTREMLAQVLFNLFGKEK